MGTHGATCTLQAIDSDFLTLGVICLTGGHDLANTPLLVFPTSTHPHLECWSSERLGQLLRHYVTWLSVTSQARSVACLADLRNASKDVINIIIEAVEKLEISSRGTISSVYFLKPQNKARSRLLKKLLGLKPSKKHPKIPLFKIVLMKTHQELINQIDLCHLTSEFGGTLTYDHASWMKFHDTVAPCLQEAETMKNRVPGLKDRVELLQDFDIHTNSVAGIQQLLNDLSQSFQHAMSEARFQETLDRLKQTLLVLDSAEGSEHWLKRVHATHVRHAAERVRELYRDLEEERVHVEETWRGIEESVTVHLQIQRHRERAAEIERRMKTHYEPLLQEHPSIGSTLSQAELYRTHFTTTLYEPSKELLSQATEILEDVQRLRERLSHVTPQCDVTDILGRLTVALQPFTHRLQCLQDVYVSVHIFHLLFQKALTWYRKVLKFLPEGLQARAEAEDEAEDSSQSPSTSSPSGSKILHMPVEWQVAVHSFLHKHPPPREQHLARLDTEIPPQVEKGLRVQARSLALRLRLLQRLLSSRRLSAKLLSTIFKWRAEVISNSSSTSSTPLPKPLKHVSPREEAFSASSQRHDPSIPPPKPARLFTARRCVSSFSSSGTTDTEDVNANLFDQQGTERHFSEQEAEVRDRYPDKHPRETSEGTIQYQRPPKVDVKIISPTQDSDSNKSNCLDSRTSEGRGSTGRSVVGQQTPDDERFIRLTFTPPVSNTLLGHSDADDSFESEDLALRYPDAQTGSESGIEVVENEDPWDSIIDRIKAVSNSNLPSDVKIQCMSHLLSQSTVADPSTRQREASSYPNVTLQQQKRGEDVLMKDVTGFDQFRQHITLPQEADVRRHQSFAIAREDVRPQHRKRQDSARSSASRSDLYTRGVTPDIWRYSAAGMEHSDPLHPHELERPANAVARMRHRLACSLMDLDEIDQHNGSADVYKNFRSKTLRPDHRRKQTESSSRGYCHDNGAESAVTGHSPRLVRVSHSPRPSLQQVQFALPHQDRPGKNRANDSVTRSYEGGLDTAHLSQAHQNPSKLVSWRSHEDGLDSLERPSFLPEKPRRNAASSGTEENGLDAAKRLAASQHVSSSSPATRKSPSRWRQGIVEDYVSSPPKERRKSKDFIAPSFLKTFHSMHNLHADTDFSTPLTLFPEPRYQKRVSGGARRFHVNGLREAESDSWSDGSRRAGQKSSLARLSDEVDQEYLSQDEVHSSLQRSQQILMEAEDALHLHAHRQRHAGYERDLSEEDDTLGPVSAPVPKQPDHPDDPPNQRHYWIRHDPPLAGYDPVQIHVTAVEDRNGVESCTDVSVSPDQEALTSYSLTAEGEFDADVSNMSDSNLDSDRKHESV